MASVQKPNTSGRSKRWRGKSRPKITPQYLNGGKLTLKGNPPQISLMPWNHLTCAFISTPGNITMSDIITKMRIQIDPSKTGLIEFAKIQFKIQSVKVWNMTGHTVAMSIYDFIDTAQDVDQIMGAMDAGTTSEMPAIGYELPLTFRHHVMRNDEKTGSTVNFLTTSAPATDSLLYHIRLLWKLDGPAKFSASLVPNLYTINDNITEVNSGIGKLINRVTKVGKNTSQGLEKVEVRVKELVDAQPSIIERLAHKVIEVIPILPADTDDLLRGITEMLRLTINESSSFEELSKEEIDNEL